ncbi:MAG: helix-turn-helix domain-containing protein [Daejeonella sp.]
MYIHILRNYTVNIDIILRKTKNSPQLCGLSECYSPHLSILPLNSNKIATNLNRIRRWKNLTMQELADMAEISIQAISHYENGIRHPESQILIRLAKALNVDLSDFYEDKDVEIQRRVFKVIFNVNIEGLSGWVNHNRIPVIMINARQPDVPRVLLRQDIRL